MNQQKTQITITQPQFIGRLHFCAWGVVQVPVHVFSGSAVKFSLVMREPWFVGMVSHSLLGSSEHC